jgi:SEC-C motif-containing protein
MRARFSAFAAGGERYLLDSWHPSTRPTTLALDPLLRWVRLDVLATDRGGLLDTDGTVEFDAHHQRGVLHEVSRFVRHERRWVYLGPLEFTRT